MKDLFLTIDCGTQSTRALVFDKEGTLVAKTKASFTPYYSTQTGYCEQHASVYWQELCRATTELTEKYPEVLERVMGVSVTAVRDTHICVDENYEPLRPVIMWLDQRKAPFKKQDIPTFKRGIFRLVGMYEAVEKQMQHCSLNWIRQCEPDIWAKTYKYLSYGDYIEHKLSGCEKYPTAGQIGHIPIDYRGQKWFKPSDLKSCMFPVEQEKLFEMVPSGTILGNITEQASKETGLPQGLPLVAAGCDKNCETIGVGCIDDRSASLSFGTAASIETTTDSYKEPIPFMPSYPSIIRGKYNPEIQIYRGYWMITWFKEQFSRMEEEAAKAEGITIEEYLDRELPDVPAGSDGLIVQPFWAPGLKEPEGRGCMIGFNDAHTRKHIYRAIIEGIGFALYDGMLAMQRKTKRKMEYVTASGGGSSSDIVCQITADIFGLPVKRVQTYETSGLGGAIVGFYGLGVYDSVESAVKKMVHFSDQVFMPNAKNHERYERIYNTVYKDLYKKVKPLYVNMQLNEKKY